MISATLKSDLDFSAGCPLLLLCEAICQDKPGTFLREPNKTICHAADLHAYFPEVIRAFKLFQILLRDIIQLLHQPLHPCHLPGMLVRERIEEQLDWTFPRAGPTKLDRPHDAS